MDDVEKSWKEFREKVRGVIEDHGAPDDLHSFDAWYAEEMRLVMAHNYPAPHVSDVTWSTEGLHVECDDREVVDRMMTAMAEVSHDLKEARARRSVMSSVVDWNDIHGSVLKQLGEHRAGWTKQLTLALEKVKRLIDEQPDLFGDERPSIVQIKQKWGGLRVYESPGCNQATSEEIQWRVDQIEQTCEGCSNSAQRQNILGFVTTLCSWCYNDALRRRFEGAEESWPDSLRLDIVANYPDLVSPDCASLAPAVGKGWLVMISQALHKLSFSQDFRALDPGTIQISDIKKGQDGQISIGFSRYHDLIQEYADWIELRCGVTCEECGHVGDIVRTADRSQVLCSHCYCTREKSDG
ncbi:hypothetical protein [Ruegeria arenilitoris]|uniref:hypothetical protein n=1 Tax=Ruegeria arenilitoris TaxID=1173585 RepID=UPI00147CEDCA|nr:hypothetical protein [Ruegeria arenilitoris]